jgi:molybdopterin-guanine dinucleotide biosynthesis protein A
MIQLRATAVIVAGGKSSRMKQDKALLPFGDCATLAEFQYLRLSKLFERVYLSSKSNKFNFKMQLIEDRYEASSPLVALVSMFYCLREEEIFVLSVDAPFVGESVILKLYESAENDLDVIVAKSSNGLEPLCAIYRRSFIEKAEEALKENRHRLQDLFKVLRVKEVKMENEEAFLNLNYPKEYDLAKRRLKK